MIYIYIYTGVIFVYNYNYNEFNMYIYIYNILSYSIIFYHIIYIAIQQHIFAFTRYISIRRSPLPDARSTLSGWGGLSNQELFLMPFSFKPHNWPTMSNYHLVILDRYGQWPIQFDMFNDLPEEYSYVLAMLNYGRLGPMNIQLHKLNL